MAITGTTRGGKPWTPTFVESIDGEKCIACGRCFKICGRTILELVPRTEDGDDEGNKVMSVAHPDDCIGCTACARACVKKCLSFVRV
jgi:Nif-specific ferredoxin III